MVVKYEIVEPRPPVDSSLQEAIDNLNETVMLYKKMLGEDPLAEWLTESISKIKRLTSELRENMEVRIADKVYGRTRR